MNDAKRTYHSLKLSLRRRFRRQKRQVEDMTSQADYSIDRHVFRRFGHLYKVRRFVLTWVVLLLFIGVGTILQVQGLDRYYLKLAPAQGGIYREGIIGTFSGANPLFAVSGADLSVSRLVFSSLFKIAPDGSFEPDLADSFKVDEKGLIYTVKLRRNVKWHDGQDFTADDVVFTYKTIQNPDVKSPLLTSWLDVDVSKVNEYTVEFKLANALSAFRFSLINGIVPQHILSRVDPADMRSSSFNSLSPIGTGPFMYRQVEVIGRGLEDKREKVTLETSDIFYEPRALIDGVVIRTYHNEEALIAAFKDQEVASMVGLQSVTDALSGENNVQTFSTPLLSSVMLFFNNSQGALAEKQVRQALVKATDATALRQSVGYQLLTSDSPFLRSHFAYDADHIQQEYNPSEAARLLDEAGWIKGEDGVRVKDKQKLNLRLASQSLTEYATVVQALQEQWSHLGVGIEAVLQPESDIQSGAVISHDYDMLLYGIAIGPDPDVFAFWHSSQADPRLRTRLNLSEYSSDKADEALEAGRTRIDEELRKVKYQPFLDAWLDDAPAVAIYQPRFLYVARGEIEGYTSGQFNSPADRFYSITNWQVRRDKVLK